MRLARAEAQAARAFETVAQILERDDTARDSDRRALIDAVRRLESIRTNLTDAAQTGERRGDRSSPSAALDPKAPFDLKAAVSQIAMRRHELEERAGRGATTGPLGRRSAETSSPADSRRLPSRESAATQAQTGVGALTIAARRRPGPGA